MAAIVVEFRRVETVKAARQARDCVVMNQALALARWIAEAPRQMTAARVLRKPDVPAACARIGVETPSGIRSAADVTALNRPWSLAVATGLLNVEGKLAAPGPALGAWPPGDGDVLDGWLAAIRAVCARESHPHDEDSVRILVLAALAVVDRGERLTRPTIRAALGSIGDTYDLDIWGTIGVLGRYCSDDRHPVPVGLVRMLACFGAITSAEKITDLGRWARKHLADDLAAPADPALAADEMLALATRFSADEEKLRHVTGGWLAARAQHAAVSELLAAAEKLTASPRALAIRITEFFGEDAVSAWREHTASPHVGPYARSMLSVWAGGPEVGEAERRWLAVESAVAALEESGPDEALTRTWERMDGDDLDAWLPAIAASGHPQSRELAEALAAFAASRAPRRIDQVLQLKVTLAHWRPTAWRSVLMPAVATLDELHNAIQVMFGWDGDHMHVFTCGKKRYGDTYYLREGAEEESGVRLHELLEPGITVRYTYDFGDDWQHEIVLEKILPREPGREYPVCVAFRGDQPVEYWSPDEDDQEPERFDLDKVNRRLAAGTGPGD
jgi:hypothetical protein